MSISTNVDVQGNHGCGLPTGMMHTFDADLMFSNLLLDKDGQLWEIPWTITDGKRSAGPQWQSGVLSIDANASLSGPEFQVVAVPETIRIFQWNGYMILNEDSYKSWSLLFADGKLQAIRPGHREAWETSVRLPQSADGSTEEVIETAPNTWMDVRGLPELPEGRHWCLQNSCLYAKLPETPWERVTDVLYPLDVHGWIFVRSTQSIDSGLEQEWWAMRLVAGHVQWRVPVLDGVAQAPAYMGELSPNASGGDDSTSGPLAMVCRVLPTDYTAYGGDAVRWNSMKRIDGDCSWGCRWWKPVRDEAKSGGSENWGVCVNPDGPRKGLLTWKQQAGRGCYKAAIRG